MENEYRGTGKTKEECQAMVNTAIARFKKDYPGEPVPVALERWVDNIPDEKDMELVRRMCGAVNIGELRKLLEAATPGPWEACGDDRGGCQCGMVWNRIVGEDGALILNTRHADSDLPTPDLEHAKANALLVAAAINALPKLLDELEQRRKLHPDLLPDYWDVR
jgi:hypothetical protein